MTRASSATGSVSVRRKESSRPAFVLVDQKRQMVGGKSPQAKDEFVDPGKRRGEVLESSRRETNQKKEPDSWITRAPSRIAMARIRVAT